MTYKREENTLVGLMKKLRKTMREKKIRKVKIDIGEEGHPEDMMEIIEK